MNRQFVALSGAAMVLIVLNHAIHMSFEFPAALGYSLIEGWPRAFLTVLQAFGAFAVPIFLFISGSFVAYAANAALRTSSPISLKFIWSGLRHILWPYIIWSIIFYIVLAAQYGQTFTPFGYLKNLITGYPFHFVPLLMFFYVSAPLLVPLARRYGLWLILGVGLLQLILLAIREPGIFYFSMPAFMARLMPPVIGNSLANWALYFPLGMVMSLHAKELKPYLLRFRWVAISLAIIIFLVGLLDAFGIITAAWARFICPVPLVLALPVINRNDIPALSLLETIGKRSYGVYLIHLIVIDLLLILIQHTIPDFLNYQLILFPILFLAGLYFPLLLMNSTSQHKPIRKVYRYVFG